MGRLRRAGDICVAFHGKTSESGETFIRFMISKKIKITQSQRHLRSVSREDFGERGSYSSSGLPSGGFLDLNRLRHPPAINYNNLTKQNLDNVVNWYKDFYKL